MGKTAQLAAVGDAVAFDLNYGPQTGTVIAIQRHVSNAQQFALVEIDHQLNSIVESIPLLGLQLLEAA
ncbi:hypothetical protein ACIPF8_01855 [Collimonas sp. NPDC087041]|uniref:hypothetical protein n=1 Tax=Collimonas sp. NPDC087041 TaxID=3363960 RepID=UPI00382404FB